MLEKSFSDIYQQSSTVRIVLNNMCVVYHAPRKRVHTLVVDWTDLRNCFSMFRKMHKNSDTRVWGGRAALEIVQRSLAFARWGRGWQSKLMRVVGKRFDMI